MNKKFYIFLTIVAALLLIQLIINIDNLISMIKALSIIIQTPNSPYFNSDYYGAIKNIVIYSFLVLSNIFLIIVVIFLSPKDEIAAKVAAMKQARQERKQSAQREKEEQKKADLQRQLDELNRKDGE